jgi:hypothetical protein
MLGRMSIAGASPSESCKVDYSQINSLGIVNLPNPEADIANGLAAEALLELA